MDRAVPVYVLAVVFAACAGCSAPPDPADPEALTLEAVEGDGAAAPARTALPGGPTVEVRHPGGNPAGGVQVSFRVTRGGGSVSPASVVTGASGRAATVWILGPEGGTPQTLEAEAGGARAEITATATAPEAGGSHVGRRGYTVWLPGNLPLIVSAPHGGSDEPEEIPDRTTGVLLKDRRTLELTLRLRDAVLERTDRLPHVVYTRLHRRKLDPNRKLQEASGGDPTAERAWQEYHAFMEAARARVEAEHGSGLVLDIHGHGHEIPRIELGYLVDETELALPDSTLEVGGRAEETSIRDLAARSPSNLAELLRGESSLGGLLEARGFDVVPGPSTPDPGSDPYFTGGYTTRRHGSLNGGTVSAIQLEHQWAGLRDTPEHRRAYVEALADALQDFFPAHFGEGLDTAVAGSEPAEGS